MIGYEPVRLVKPAVLPVTLEEFAAQSRLGDNWLGEFTLLTRLLEAATSFVEDYTGLGLITQVWEQRFPRFADPMVLRRRPLQPEVPSSPADPTVTVTYLDADDVGQELDATVYRVVGAGGAKFPASIRLGSGQTWPSVNVGGEPVRVRYRVGFGAGPADVPENIRHAVLLTAATWYDFRENLVMGGGAMQQMPIAAEALLREYRPLAVA